MKLRGSEGRQKENITANRLFCLGTRCWIDKYQGAKTRRHDYTVFYSLRVTARLTGDNRKGHVNW